ncbi:MAG: NAD(P)-dependent alcohol dehydrogenase, partial [Acidobacteriota bacterium]
LQEIEKPVVTDEAVMVRVRAASDNALDWHTVHGGRLVRMIAAVMRAPASPVRGADLAGEVVAVGKNVTRFQPGDEVFGTARGTFAEYAAAKEGSLAPKPRGLSFAQAAAIPVAGITALQGLRDKGEVKRGERVLVNGAGGGVGTFAVQVAKALGAHVTAVTGPNNVELIRSIGPDETLDRTQDDFATRGREYDVIFDVAADRPLADCRRALTPTGRLVLAGAAKNGNLAIVGRLLEAVIRSRFEKRRFLPFMARVTSEDLLELKELIETGRIRPVIDREYQLSEGAEAVRYVGTGQARAKVVINVA